MAKYNVIVADNSPAYYHGIRLSLKRTNDEFNIIKSREIDNLLFLLRSKEFDLLILSCHYIKKRDLEYLNEHIFDNGVKVLLLFECPSSEIRLARSKINCRGILKKTANFDEFNHTVNTILNNGNHFPEYDDAVYRVSPLSSYEVSLLSRQELKVLQHITKGKINKQIAYDLVITESTVKAHITSILKKLRLPNRTILALAHYRYKQEFNYIPAL